MGSYLQSVDDVTQEVLVLVNLLSNSATQREIICEALQARDDDRQNAYHERNELVAFLSRIYPSHLSKHYPDPDPLWDTEWGTVVCVHIGERPRPLRNTGWVELVEENLCWHIHDSEIPLFSHLEMRENDWDGSDTAEKYERLRSLP